MDLSSFVWLLPIGIILFLHFRLRGHKRNWVLRKYIFILVIAILLIGGVSFLYNKIRPTDQNSDGSNLDAYTLIITPEGFDSLVSFTNENDRAELLQDNGFSILDSIVNEKEIIYPYEYDPKGYARIRAGNEFIKIYSSSINRNPLRVLMTKTEYVSLLAYLKRKSEIISNSFLRIEYDTRDAFKLGKCYYAPGGLDRTAKLYYIDVYSIEQINHPYKLLPVASESQASDSLKKAKKKIRKTDKRDDLERIMEENRLKDSIEDSRY